MDTSPVAETTADAPPWLPRSEGERVLWHGGPRIQTVLPPLTIALLVVVGSVGAALLIPEFPLAIGLLGLLGLSLPLGTYLWVRTTEYVVTTDGLSRKSGLVGRRVTSISHESVQNIAYSQGVFGTLFGHGTVTFDIAGDAGAGLAFRFVDDLQVVRDLAEKRHARDDDLPGTLDQWRAVREEVRGVRTAVERQAGQQE